MKADGVFEGGGMRGIGIIGALSYFETAGYKWQRVAGTSVGAVIAACVAAGYSATEMARLIMNADFSKFLDRDRVQRMPVFGKAFGLFREKAIYSGDYTEKWIYDLLAAKGIYKFKDVSTNGESNLKMVASDITRKSMIILPDDLIKYGIDPMEFEISKAVRMSASIPFYFKPVKLVYNNLASYIVDGGICNNYPITIFDNKSTPRWPTIGFKFDSPRASYTGSGRTDPLSFMFDIADTMSGKQKTEYLIETNLIRTVLIPTMGVEPTQFRLSKEKGQNLFRSGYKSAREFLKEWDYEEYKKKFRE